MNEFSIIEKYFSPLTMGVPGASNLRNDGAVISFPKSSDLVVTSDTLNEGVHFMIGEDPEMIARKALRVNLSDLASMGATPVCYQLNIAFPEAPKQDWLARFSGALYEDNTHYDIYCSGGDTTGIKSDYLSISITAMGGVPKGKVIRRSDAQDGDALVLSGLVGDSVLGLKLLLEGEDPDTSEYKEAIMRYRMPEPRVGIDDILRRYVNAAADISDGLIADSSHIAKASGLGLRIDLTALVFSEAVEKAVQNSRIKPEEVACGGDDYELILAVPTANLDALLSELRKRQLNPIVIGEYVDKALGIEIIGNGKYRIDDLMQGWQHF